MQYLTLDIIKKHLNLDSDFTDDDSYLEMLGGVVEQVVEKHIDVKFEVLKTENGGELPLPLKQAMLLLLGTYYSNRENIAFASGAEVPTTYKYLISLYQNYGDYIGDETSVFDEIYALFIKNTENISALGDKVEKNTEDIEEIKKHKLSGGTSIDIDDEDYTHTINLDDINQGEY